MMLLKKEFSYWINKNTLISKKFEWQDEYFAFYLGQSFVYRVKNHIRNQEEHHRKSSFQQEYNGFMRKYGFERLILG